MNTPSAGFPLSKDSLLDTPTLSVGILGWRLPCSFIFPCFSWSVCSARLALATFIDNNGSWGWGKSTLRKQTWEKHRISSRQMFGETAEVSRSLSIKMEGSCSKLEMFRHRPDVLLRQPLWLTDWLTAWWCSQRDKSLASLEILILFRRQFWIHFLCCLRKVVPVTTLYGPSLNFLDLKKWKDYLLLGNQILWNLILYPIYGWASHSKLKWTFHPCVS